MKDHARQPERAVRHQCGRTQATCQRIEERHREIGQRGTEPGHIPARRGNRAPGEAQASFIRRWTSATSSCGAKPSAHDSSGKGRRSNEVLVAESLDVGWTPIFSYAAIVAREFAIPCVVGSKTGSRVLRAGHLVEVDGASGFVRGVE
jgi:hypothetical protein